MHKIKRGATINFGVKIITESLWKTSGYDLKQKVQCTENKFFNFHDFFELYFLEIFFNVCHEDSWKKTVKIDMGCKMNLSFYLLRSEFWKVFVATPQG